MTDERHLHAVRDEDETVADTLRLELRPMRDGDRNFVLSSWLRSYAEANEFRGMKRSSYFALYAPVVEVLLGRSTVMVATMPEASDVVLGWLAAEGELLHYVLTKPRWRKLGIARFMLADMKDLAVKYTHQAPRMAPIPAAWTYDSDARFRKAAA